MKKTILLLILAFATILCAQSAMSTTTTIYPNADSTYTAWSSYGCASDYQCLMDSDITDYLNSSVSAQKESVEFDDPALSMDATINSVAFNYYAKYYSSVKRNFKPIFVSIPGAVYYGNLFNTTSTYQYYRQTYSTNPNTKIAWTVYDLNNLEAGMYVWPTQGGANVAYMYVTVNYTNTSAPFSDLTISSIDFEEYNYTYDASTNETNITITTDSIYVSVNTTIYNEGLGVAGTSNTELIGLSTFNWYTPIINPSSSLTFSRNYNCTAPHNYNATADYYNVLYEDDETNNEDSTYIDCIV